MTEKKQPEALRTTIENAKGLKAVGMASYADLAVLELHALCEEQKRLLEQARDALNWRAPGYDHAGADKTFSAITAHLLQQEGEKHDAP